MARFKCPQCGRRFGSVGEMLGHTEEVHANAEPYSASGAEVARTRSMPSTRPGPVATERASQTGFEPQGADEAGTFERGSMEPSEEGEEEKQNPALGTVIALVVIAVIILLNILGGGSE